MNDQRDRGIANKQENSQMYMYPQYIVSMDDNDSEMRCGRLDSFFQSESGAWCGLTVAQLFKKTWVPNEFLAKWKDDTIAGSGGFDPKESVIGKKCYIGHWQGTRRADKTTDTSIMRPGESIGTVIAEQGLWAIVRVNPAFIACHEFQTEGRWCEMADPSELKPGDKVYTERPRTARPVNVTVPQHVLDRYPIADLEQMLELAKKHTPDLLRELPTGDDLKRLRLNLRYMNPICENPGCTKTKNEVLGYILCDCCQIVLYCSSKCKEENMELHKEWAGRLPNSPPPAYNPQSPMIIVYDDETRNRATAVYKYDSNGEIVCRSLP